MKLLSFNLVIGVTGCAQAEYTPLLIQRLLPIQEKVDLSLAIVATESSVNFFDASHVKKTVGSSRFFSSYFDHNSEFHVPHIQLAEWADMVVVYPCSANTLARAAHGFTDELLTNIIIATRCPVYLGPTMNEAMYSSKVVQKNLKTVKSLGYKLLPRKKSQVFVHSQQKHILKDFISHEAVVKAVFFEIRKKLKKRHTQRALNKASIL